MQSFSELDFVVAGETKNRGGGVHSMLWSSVGICGSVLVLAAREMGTEPHLRLKRPSACVWAR